MIYAFGSCEFDQEKRELRRDGAPVAIEPQAFDVLGFLISNRDRAVSRSELLEACWPGVHVSDGTLSRCLTRVRSALGQARGEETPIKTMHGRGYRFTATIRTVGAPKLDEEEIEAEIAEEAAAVPVGPEQRFITALRAGLRQFGEGSGGAEARHVAARKVREAVAPIIRARGGVLREGTSDSILVHFEHSGAAAPAAEGALLVADAMVETASRLGLQIRAAVSTGRLISDVATASDGEARNVRTFAAIGPERLQHHADPGTWVVDEPTAEIASGRYAVERRWTAEDSLGPVTVCTMRLKTDVELHDAELPFFGRSSELFALEQVWERARKGRGGVALVRGEAGIGKTRLVREFAERSAAEGAELLLAKGSPLHQMTPFRPLLDLLRKRLGLDEDAVPVRMLAALEMALEASGRPAEDSLPVMASLMVMTCSPECPRSKGESVPGLVLL